MRSERVLVTGAAGFIGGHACHALLHSGYDVVGIDNFDPFYDRSLKEETVAGLSTSSCFEFVEGDIREESTLAEVLDGVTAVVHLAARPGVRQSITNPGPYASINIEGTVHVLEACRRAGVSRLVFASSSTVYGDSHAVPFTEDGPLGVPLSPYAVSKRAGEQLCLLYSRLHGLSVAALRLFTAYGPRTRPDLVVHKFSSLVLQGGAVQQYGDGSMERDYTHISDIAQGIVRAVRWTESGDHSYEAFNIGSGRAVRLDDLIGLIAQAAALKPVVEQHAVPVGEMELTCADTGKARQVLGFESGVSIEDGIVDFVDWYRGKYGHQSSSAT
jgi:UDP-glucuronate 4-epimerase